MTLHVKIGDDYKVVYKAWFKVGGVWKAVPSIHYKFGGVWKLAMLGQSAFVLDRTLTGTVYNFNVYDAALEAGWDGTSGLIANIALSNALVLSSVSGLSAFSSGFDLPSGSSLTLTIDASSKIIGRGGKGGDGGFSTPAQSGGAGSDAITLSLDTTIVNNGLIAGGGGGGGGGSGSKEYYGRYARGGGGGGGAGFGGAGAANGGAGSQVGGAGGVAHFEYFAIYEGDTIIVDGEQAVTGIGGVGGGLASVGAAGTYVPTKEAGDGYADYWTATSAAGLGGAAGRAIIGGSFLTLSGTGNLYGAII